MELRKKLAATLITAATFYTSPALPDFQNISFNANSPQQHSQHERHPEKSPLEELIEPKDKYHVHLKPLPVKENSEIDPETNARVIWAYRLPEGILGMYIPSQHIFYTLDPNAQKKKGWVYHHENGHASGIEDEKGADAYAFKKTGYLLRFL